MPTPRFAPLFLAIALSAGAVQAHEFWIDPHAFRVAPGDEIEADLRVGQNFEGVASSYLPNAFRRFELAQGEATEPVEGRLGDRPALSQAAPGEGLAIAVHVTTDSVVTYRDFETFESFVRHKDAEWVLAEHAARQLPTDILREGYSRYAKALIAVGEGGGEDRQFGLETELVARANPYTDDVSGGLPVDLYYKGEPRSKAQVEIFGRTADGSIEVSTVRTDSEGRAVVPVVSGNTYMLDAVVLREPEGDLAKRPDIVWESLWANLTFAVPD